MPIKSARQKGYRGEVQAVKALQDCGFDAERVFGSGAFEKQLGPNFKGDICLTTAADCFAGEVKVRAKGFTQLYNWLEHGGKDFLMVKADRKDFLMVIPMDTVMRLLHADNVDPQDES